MPMPQVLGGGYEWIQSAIDGNLAVATLLALLVGKTWPFDHLQLIPLLRAGIPLDLPDGKQLQLGSLASASSWVGRSASEQTGEGAEAELIAVLRGGHLHMPDRALILEAEDRLLFLASPDAWDDIRRQLAGDEVTLRAAGGAAGGLARND